MNNKMNFNGTIGNGTYKGFDFEIWSDTDAQNPWESRDGNIPLITKSKDYSKGDISFFLSGEISDGQIIKHQKSLFKALELDADDYEAKEDKIDDIRYGIQTTKDLYTLSIVAQITKTPYKLTSSTGYSQGDYATLLFVATEDFFIETGVERKRIDDEYFESIAKIWGAWAWGSVYGYTITYPSGESESVGGYYGYDHEESGIFEAIRSDINNQIKYTFKAKINKLKQLIKSKVPTIYREPILAQYKP